MGVLRVIEGNIRAVSHDDRREGAWYGNAKSGGEEGCVLCHAKVSWELLCRGVDRLSRLRSAAGRWQDQEEWWYPCECSVQTTSLFLTDSY